MNSCDGLPNGAYSSKCFINVQTAFIVSICIGNHLKAFNRYQNLAGRVCTSREFFPGIEKMATFENRWKDRKDIYVKVWNSSEIDCFQIMLKRYMSCWQMHILRFKHVLTKLRVILFPVGKLFYDIFISCVNGCKQRERRGRVNREENL